MCKTSKISAFAEFGNPMQCCSDVASSSMWLYSGSLTSFLGGLGLGTRLQAKFSSRSCIRYTDKLRLDCSTLQMAKTLAQRWQGCCSALFGWGRVYLMTVMLRLIIIIQDSCFKYYSCKTWRYRGYSTVLYPIMCWASHMIGPSTNPVVV